MKTLHINGDIVSNDIAWIYDWYGMECATPAKVRAAVDSLEDGETLTVKINSGGGDVMAGQEIFSILNNIRHIIIVEIQSLAGSAASMIAMAGGHVIMSPVAMLMIHNAYTSSSGDYRDMEHTAGVLKKVNSAIAQSYIQKTGMSEEELLDLMDRETWLTAADCLKYGFADEIAEPDSETITNSVIGGLSITPEMMARAKTEKEAKEKIDAECAGLISDLDDYGV